MKAFITLPDYVLCQSYNQFIIYCNMIFNIKDPQFYYHFVFVVFSTKNSITLNDKKTIIMIQIAGKGQR